jgi:hypothetical protein
VAHNTSISFIGHKNINERVNKNCIIMITELKVLFLKVPNFE